MSQPVKPRGSNVTDMGLDVKLSSEKLENDQWASNTLREVGKSMTEPGMEYKGTVAIHYYTSGQLNLNKDVHIKHQLIGNKQGAGLAEAINEQVAAFSLADAALKVRQHYNPTFQHKTTNSNDKRS